MDHMKARNVRGGLIVINPQMIITLLCSSSQLYVISEQIYISLSSRSRPQFYVALLFWLTNETHAKEFWVWLHLKFQVFHYCFRRNYERDLIYNPTVVFSRSQNKCYLHFNWWEWFLWLKLTYSVGKQRSEQCWQRFLQSLWVLPAVSQSATASFLSLEKHNILSKKNNPVATHLSFLTTGLWSNLHCFIVLSTTAYSSKTWVILEASHCLHSCQSCSSI